MDKDRILIIYDRDEEYARLMTEYLMGCSFLPWKTGACTLYEDLEKVCRGRTPEIILTTGASYDERIERLGAGRVVVLDDGTAGAEGAVKKYQPADETLRALLDIYAQDTGDDWSSDKTDSEIRAKLIGIFSPVRRCYQTTFSVLMGRLLLYRGKVLYLSFEFCQGCEELMPPGGAKNLSDLMYFINSPRDVFALRFRSMVRSIAGLDYIPCAVSGCDLSEIPGEEWKTFLTSVCTMGDYSYVILDLTENVRGLFGVLRMCDRIYTLTKNDRVARNKLENYENLLNMYNYSDVIDKSIKCSIPPVKRVPSFSGDMCGELVDYIGKQLGEL